MQVSSLALLVYEVLSKLISHRYEHFINLEDEVAFINLADNGSFSQAI